MMNLNEIRNTISTIESATLCRTKTMGNFYAIPTENGYVAVKVSELLAKDTETHKAFDIASARAEYEAFAKAQEEKANKPKKEKGVNAEAQARRDAMDATIAEWFANSAEKGKRYSATEVKDAIPALTEAVVMMVGSSCLRLAKDGKVITEKGEKGKNLYYIG